MTGDSARGRLHRRSPTESIPVTLPVHFSTLLVQTPHTLAPEPIFILDLGCSC